MSVIDTPLIQQWREIKSRHADALLFFRVGDFYELFNEDAEEGARLLGLTLTSRNNGASRAPLAGIPVHALNGYLQKLVRMGRRVAICEQVEDPAQAKGVVRREVVETVTPGTILADALLNARRNNFLAAVAGNPADELPIGVAWTDLSTGELSAQATTWTALPDLLGQLEPAEILFPRTWELFGAPGPPAAARTYRADWTFEVDTATGELRRRFEVLTLDGFGFQNTDWSLVGACGALVAYLAEAQPSACAGLRHPRILRGRESMLLDEMTRRNLELVEPLDGTGRSPTLLSVLDDAATPMGARLLRRWVLAPLSDLGAIQSRHDAVEELVSDPVRRAAVRTALATIRDQERLAGKIAGSRASPRDLLAVQESLERVPAIRAALDGVESELLVSHLADLHLLPELRDLISTAIHPDAPPTAAEGGVIRPGFDPTLDELRSVREGAVDWIARLQSQERLRTGIPSLKIGFNRVFGYYLEVTRPNLDRVPVEYQRRQTLANAERYVTPELKEWEEKVLGADERILELESRLLQQVRAEAAGMVPSLQRLAGEIAAVDVFATLAEVAVRRGYVRPALDGGTDLTIRAGRHPVVETMMPREEFIPNDVCLNGRARIMILSGPNMAGKSTVLRQVGLITLMAQVGSFVPAREARIGLVDRIFTRVGASDNLVRGQSTFMVEMTETAAILNGATDRSLVLLDEIGRGTSTWDGLSVATAVTEFLHERVGAKTIFATHYHELARLADRLPGVVNFSVAVKEDGDRIVFLRSLLEGASDRSYGVEVARLAGLPPAVIERARHLLCELEAQASTAGSGEGPRRPRLDDQQLALFGPPTHPVVERLRSLDPNRLTPLEALILVSDLVVAARD